jgi:capsule biosynthesis phosphatase
MTLKVLVLCGGAGTRFGDSVYPKPMNLVRGVPMIYHVLDSLACDHITFVYNRGLDAVGFRQYVLNTFKEKKCDFVRIGFQTRGPAETLLLGLKSLYGDDQLLVLDNDNVYDGLDLSALPSGNFVLYNNNPTGLAHYSFVKLDNNGNIAEIEERRQISDFVCVGGYGFANLTVCRDFCKQLIRDDTGESFLSQVFRRMLRSGLTVKGHYSANVFSIGTEKDISLNSSKLTPYKLRVVFDLDNTLVTWPNIYKDYSTVKRIEHIAQFSAQLKKQGHEVVICTARNTVTCGHNVGKVVKNVGITTLESLRQLGLEYDEIHFGKPYGDIYIDDKAFNTYDESLFRKLGFYDFQPTTSKDQFKTNKYNVITRVNKTVVQKQDQRWKVKSSFTKCCPRCPN